MYDVLVKSAIFGVRNNNKVKAGDKGRVFAEIGQMTNAVKAAAQLDNKVGRGTQAAVDIMCSAAKENKVLDKIGKGANWASKNVNPLLVGAAGYRVLKADNKEKALKKEIYGMGTMFAAENMMKTFFNSATYKNAINSIKNEKLKALVGIVQGVTFVAGSIAGSTLGYKVGDYLFGKDEKKSEKTTAQNTTNPDKIDESEYFIMKSDKVLA